MFGTKWLLVVFLAVSLYASPVPVGGGGGVLVVNQFHVGEFEDADNGGEGGVDANDDKYGDEEVVVRDAVGIPDADPCSGDPCPIGTQCNSSLGTNYTCDEIYDDPCSPSPCPIDYRCERTAMTDVYICFPPPVPAGPSDDEVEAPVVDPFQVGESDNGEGDVYDGEGRSLSPSADPCSRNPCPVGTRCRRFGTRYVCDEIDPCRLNPCFFGERCESLGDRHRCITTQPEMDPCHPNPCPGGRRCSKIGGGLYVCLAPPLPADPCLKKPCPLHQQCAREGRTGFRCIVPYWPTFGPCNRNPCLNGGRCFTAFNTPYFCVCKPMYSGMHCEVAPPTFSPSDSGRP